MERKPECVGHRVTRLISQCRGLVILAERRGSIAVQAENLGQRRDCVWPDAGGRRRDGLFGHAAIRRFRQDKIDPPAIIEPPHGSMPATKGNPPDELQCAPEARLFTP